MCLASDIFPSLSFLAGFFFSSVLHVTRLSVIAGSIRQYLDPTEVARVVQSSRMPEGLLCLPAETQEHGVDSRRQTVTLEELESVLKSI